MAKKAMTLVNSLLALIALGRAPGERTCVLAVNARLVEFRGPQRLVISEEQHENLSFKSNA